MRKIFSSFKIKVTKAAMISKSYLLADSIQLTEESTVYAIYMDYDYRWCSKDHSRAGFRA